MISQIVTTWLVFSGDQHWWLALEPAASEMIQIMATAANAVRTDTYQRLPLLLFMPPAIAANLIPGREGPSQHAVVPDHLSAYHGRPIRLRDGWAWGARPGRLGQRSPCARTV